MPYDVIPPAGPDRPIQATSGRGSFKLTQPRFTRIVELVGIGNYIEVACNAAGLTSRSYHRYLERGRQVQHLVDQHLLTDEDDDVPDTLTDTWKTSPRTTDPAHPIPRDRRDPWPIQPPEQLRDTVHPNDWTCWLLCRAVERAQAEAEAFAVGQVRKHMGEDWRAAAMFLERSKPGRWRQRNQVDVRPAMDAAEAAEEEAVLGDAGASALMHRALAQVAGQRALPDVDGEAVEVEAGSGSTAGGALGAHAG